MVINMIYMININTEIFLRSVKDLNKLKLLVEVNNLDRPNFSAIARELGVDRRTVKKYYDGDIKKVRKSKKSKIDDELKKKLLELKEFLTIDIVFETLCFKSICYNIINKFWEKSFLPFQGRSERTV